MAEQTKSAKKFTFYMLECIDKRYYGGRTEKNKYERFYEHYTGNGSEFTKNYNPLRIIESFESDDPFDEDKLVLRYMDKFGIDNVRGGSFSKLVLSDIEIEMINKQLRNANDKCQGCGLAGHFIKDCKNQVSKTDQKDVNHKSVPIEKIKSPAKRIPTGGRQKKMCTRCGRTGHLVQNCFANSTMEGYALGEIGEDSDEMADCQRCGRDGHYDRECFAKTDIDDEPL
jgi:hypothetical protein